VSSPDSKAEELKQSFEDFRLWLDSEEGPAAAEAGTPEEAAEEASPEADDRARWKRIGRDVYHRKLLVLIAAKALDANGVPRPLRHAATDVLVEKAQFELTERASQMNRYGAWAYGTALALLIGGVVWLYVHAGGKPDKDLLNGYGVTLSIMRTSTAAAVLFAAIYFLVALARALLAEGALLLNRRHALRYLRLCVYLTDGDLRLADLRRMFNWNAEFATAFEKIDPERGAAGMPLNRIVEALGVIARVTPAVARRARRIVEPGSK
jgi:hypothetical protein